jgi:hypothetical protein
MQVLRKGIGSFSSTVAPIRKKFGARKANDLIFMYVQLSCFFSLQDCLFNHLLRIEYSTFVHSSIIKHE